MTRQTQAIRRRTVLGALPLLALAACGDRGGFAFAARPTESPAENLATRTAGSPAPGRRPARRPSSRPSSRTASSATASDPPLYPNETPELRVLINRWADHYRVPRDLVHAQVKRESRHQPHVRAGPYWGLMQLLPQTARTMGFSGPNERLLDPDVNLQYGVKYLAGAWLVSGGDKTQAMKWYARGYYYEAKRLGLLKETGLI
ncbi:MAG: transglycosylase [Rhodobacterales bacterium]|nr:MAG: transglycosylase [Rhodobacterales bacterium]